MDAELLSLALQSPPAAMNDAASYFQERGLNEKAVLLYQKAGNMGRALELCFGAQLFDSLHQICDGLGKDSDADPELVNRAAQYFLEHEQFGKAVDLFIKVRRCRLTSG